jgi:hypothetical protein
MIGRTLGRYLVESKLGEGGMGQVYRARDLRLDREVAIKILPQDVAHDPERQRRFEREARSVASLSHPNVLALFDTGTEDGQMFVVTELLAGETLRDRLQSGGLTVRRSVDVGIQIARGLAAAHSRALVHRDLKPENVFLTKDGLAKILDFGLVKDFDPAGAKPMLTSETPTAIAPTDPGLVMGTPGYMAPEQVRGLAVDGRTDVFALGAVLYEMLAGRRAFARETVADTMTAILREDPPALSDQRPALEPVLLRIIDHCLEKDPERRFQNAADVVFALELALGPSSGNAAAIVPVGPAENRIRRLTYGQGTVNAARFVPGSRELIFSARWLGREPEVFSMNPDALEPRSLGLKRATLVAVSNRGELAVKRGPRLWAGMELGELVRVNPGGSERIEVPECCDADWLPDGSKLATVYPRAPSFWQATLDFRRKGLLECRGRAFSSMRVAPHGKELVLFEQSSPVRGDGCIALVDLDGRRRPIVDVKGFSGMAWGPLASEVWFCQYQNGSSSIWSMKLDGSKRLLMQQAGLLDLHDVAPDGRVLVALTQVVHGSMGLTSGDAVERELAWNDATETFDVSKNGTKLLLGAGGYYSSGTGRRTVYLRDLERAMTVTLGEGVAACFTNRDREVFMLSGMQESAVSMIPVDAGTSREMNIGDARALIAAEPTPDGRFAVIQDGDDWRLCDLTTGTSRRLVGGEYTWFTGLRFISPDGTQLLLGRTSGGWLRPALVVLPLEGGEPVELKGIEPGDIPTRWTEDGRSIYVFNRDGLPARIHRVALDNGERTTVREIMPVNSIGLAGITSLAMTPDASFIAYNYQRRLSDLYLIEGLS